MIRQHPMHDDWLGKFPNPALPHAVRRRRNLRRAVLVALPVALAAGLYWGAPYVGMVAVALFGGAHG